MTYRIKDRIIALQSDPQANGSTAESVKHLIKRGRQLQLEKLAALETLIELQKLTIQLRGLLEIDTSDDEFETIIKDFASLFGYDNDKAQLAYEFAQEMASPDYVPRSLRTEAGKRLKTISDDYWKSVPGGAEVLQTEAGFVAHAEGCLKYRKSLVNFFDQFEEGVGNGAVLV